MVVAALLVAHTECLPQAPAIIDTLNDAATNEVCSDVESWNVLPGECRLCARLYILLYIAILVLYGCVLCSVGLECCARW